MTLFLAVSCSTLKRYGSVEPPVTDNTLADIDLFGFRLADAVPATDSKSLWDLSADAQSQYIKILNARYPANEEFMRAMNLRYLNPADQLPDENFVKKELRMIFSVSKQRKYGRAGRPGGPVLTSADRLEYLRITLSLPPDAGIKFTGWNRYATEYGSVDIAGVSFSRSVNADVSGYATGGKKDSGEGLNAGGQASVSRKEEQQLRYRYLMLNGSIRSDRMVMEEEGTRELDLTGNIAADVSLEFDRIPVVITAVSGIKDSAGRFNPPEKLLMNHSEMYVPKPEEVKDTVFADLRMDYVFRNVINGEKTFQEWDDKVMYCNGTINKRIALITSSDYLPGLFCIAPGNDNVSGGPVRLEKPDGGSFPLIFRTAKEAESLIAWLRDFAGKPLNAAKGVTLNGCALTSGDKVLTGQMLNEYSPIRILPYYRHTP